MWKTVRNAFPVLQKQRTSPAQQIYQYH